MTIPSDALRRADRLAQAWDRSRSWVIGEAIRLLPAERPDHEGNRPSAALDSGRRRLLADDIRLSVLDRVLAAERIAREAPRRSFPALFVSFDRFEDYHQWKQMEAAGLL